MEICDVCNAGVTNGSGGLLSTKELVSFEPYWRKLLSRIPEVLTLAPAERDAALNELIQGVISQESAWYLCPSCLTEIVGPSSAIYRAAIARRKGEQFNTGPAPRSAVKFPSLASKVPDSVIPKPTGLRIYGNGFVPSLDQSYVCIASMLHAYGPKLTASHLSMITIETAKTPFVDDLETFAGIQDKLVAELPGAFILDVLQLDRSNQRHMALFAFWKPPHAKVAQQELTKRDDYIAYTAG